MARPRKRRRVCSLPGSNAYGPLGVGFSKRDVIIMSIEEYETIRLIDFEELTQEQCSLQMKVARTTVQRIYSDARKKISDSLVNGKVLKLEGGDYSLCSEDDVCTSSYCNRRLLSNNYGRIHGKNK